ncbi:General transcription factor IIF subunit 2 [Pleodorina starrii]|uniref:General transcription factor IIF subunit 2 n=1 Tax=Pleodorina starrii TaxID=330485 RepID=A0A9W6BN16_9CHLO|nr:General transcription factor IIF subunit 2 [Pleodorina starrii]GLC54592.1 General transcription factor IIF subunit 2 [Pleodorina starrii]GLC67888.1 General transcription factor IIF subunit 2 [Pleodorina starrii]
MALDIRNADSTAWLIKVPYALASVWKAACEQSMAGQVDDSSDGPSLLGRIVTEPATEGGNVSFLELPEAMLAEGIPPRFKLQQMPLPPGGDAANKMHVMSYEVPAAAAAGGGGAAAAASTPAGREISRPRMDGAIQQRMDMVPMVQDDKGEWVLDSEYLKLVRSRTEQAAEKVRVVGYYEDTVDNMLADLAQQKRVERDILSRKKATVAAAKADNLKRPRLEKDELEEKLFRLFERNSAWALKALIAETRQPHMHLKAVLEGIASQQKRGPNKDKYELKPEYRSKSRAPPGGSAEDG